jgi:hypothetical protein
VNCIWSFLTYERHARIIVAVVRGRSLPAPPPKAPAEPAPAEAAPSERPVAR